MLPTDKSVSLPEVHRTVVIPTKGSFWKKLLAYAGPGYLVSVGAVKKKEDTHRMAEANKAFAHFKW